VVRAILMSILLLWADHLLMVYFRQISLVDCAE
jgi:hypothetical protein